MMSFWFLEMTQKRYVQQVIFPVKSQIAIFMPKCKIAFFGTIVDFIIQRLKSKHLVFIGFFEGTREFFYTYSLL